MISGWDIIIESGQVIVELLALKSGQVIVELLACMIPQTLQDLITGWFMLRLVDGSYL